MTQNTYNPHHSTLGIVKALRDGEVQAHRSLDSGMSASVDSLRSRDKLTMGLRSALNAGIPIEELASSTGLSPDQIRQRVARPLLFDY